MLPPRSRVLHCSTATPRAMALAHSAWRVLELVWCAWYTLACCEACACLPSLTVSACMRRLVACIRRCFRMRLCKNGLVVCQTLHRACCLHAVDQLNSNQLTQLSAVHSQSTSLCPMRVQVSDMLSYSLVLYYANIACFVIITYCLIKTWHASTSAFSPIFCQTISLPKVRNV